MTIRRSLLSLICLASYFAAPPASAQIEVPEPLELWRQWVLYGEDFRACPLLNGWSPSDQSGYICAWPGELNLAIDAERADFSQVWTVYAEAWVPLPGNQEIWPSDLTIGGAAQAAVLRQGRPMIRLAVGSYRINGSLSWTTRPASIPVPVQTGLLRLTLDDQAITNPEIEDGQLWLGLRAGAIVEEDQLSVNVYRRLTDGLPIRVETRIELDIAGQSREVALQGALLPGFVGEALRSELPVQLDPDGTLRTQVRPGRWIVSVMSRHPQLVQQIDRPAAVNPWPADEIWSFQSQPRLRVSALEGALAIDSQRSGVPGDWQNLPSYRVTAGASVNLVERSRNDASNENRLSLQRNLWLDFDGGGFTAQDRVQGQMRSEWRLDMAVPYTMTMASIDEENLLVTDGLAAGLQGVELRELELRLESTARLAAMTQLPVTGYTELFGSVNTTLHLPPGHRLVAAPGADSAFGAWLERWRLLDVFLVLIVAVASWRLFGVVPGLVALAALVLMFHEPLAPRWSWLNLILAMALLRVAPVGRLKTFCRRYQMVSIAALVLLLIPFTVAQLRVVVFPQLEQYSLQRGISSDFERSFAAFSASPERSQFFRAADAVSSAGVDRSRNTVNLLEEVMVTGSRISKATDRYQPGALVQTGPGLPDWAWNRYELEFRGPVQAGQTYRMIIFGPGLTATWRVASVVLALALFWLLARTGFRWPTQLLRAGPSAAAALVAVMLWPDAGHAQELNQFPSPALLAELKVRLTEPAACHPICAELNNATLELADETLRLQLEFAVQATVAVPIPGDGQTWQPQSITVDGVAAGILHRGQDGQLWLRLNAGVHDVVAQGLIAATDSLTLPFPLMPHRINVAADGWDVAGITEGRLPSGALELIRQRQGDDANAELPATVFSPYASVIRTLSFELDWSVNTVVRRVAPAQAAFTLPITLLPDEAVVTPGIEVDGGTAIVAFAPGQDVVSWESRIPSAEQVTLTAVADAPSTESWRFAVGYLWHADYVGFPESPPEFFSSAIYTPEYFPRPGESLTLNITRPEPASGDTIAIDGVQYTRAIGARASQSNLDFEFRSTRGTEHVITLPAASELDSVAIDGNVLPLRLSGNSLSIPITPGEHNVNLAWRNSEGIALRATLPAVDLGAGASNLTLGLQLPNDRWVLYTSGPTLGTAVLYWAELLVFVIAAFILGRLAFSPLRSHEWLLLGLGLSTFAWPVLLLFGVWAFVMSWRSSAKPELSRLWFNALQCGLAGLTLVALLALLGAIPFGLLGAPNMQIVSPVEFNALSWFADRSNGPTPIAATFSVSLWFYKAAMLAWALWLSFALLRWLPWAWRAYSHGGFWQGRVTAGPATGA
jgi:hypothetical protein